MPTQPTSLAPALHTPLSLIERDGVPKTTATRSIDVGFMK